MHVLYEVFHVPLPCLWLLSLASLAALVPLKAVVILVLVCPLRVLLLGRFVPLFSPRLVIKSVVL